ncbi:MAG: ABC transporter ATP-binding protein [Actinomycetota bacterium]
MVQVEQNVAAERMPVLDVCSVTLAFGGIVALSDVSLTAHPDRIVGIIGPNGAGKSSLFNVLSGLVSPTRGTATLDGADLLGRPPWQRARAGLARTFQTSQLLPAVSALENVAVGFFARQAPRFTRDLLVPPSLNRRRRLALEAAREALRLVDSRIDPESPVASLSLAQQRFVELARALCGEPRLLLLDEPFGGLHTDERHHMAELVAGVAEPGVSVLLIEHDMEMVGRLCDWTYVLDFGHLIAQGPPRSIAEDPVVIRAYLGRAVGAGA